MERYFILDKFNTWYDWRLIVTAKDITPPEPKTNYVDIEGMSGSLDFSEALTGEITYRDRTISASFWTSDGTRKDREKLLRDIITALHGRKIKIIEPDDPTHYFYGRVTVKSSKNILPYLEFTIEAICDPWRYSLDDTSRSITASNQPVDVVIHNDGVKTVCPTIVVSDAVTLDYNGGSIFLTLGEYKISDIKFPHGVNIVTVSGAGDVTFKYKEADL